MHATAELKLSSVKATMTFTPRTQGWIRATPAKCERRALLLSVTDSITARVCARARAYLRAVVKEGRARGEGRVAQMVTGG